jgi:UDP-N-acetylmuramyl pentapeptide phosphotransferase/UDP-N-acetylglucosamine-1-phosphate transferase
VTLSGHPAARAVVLRRGATAFAAGAAAAGAARLAYAALRRRPPGGEKTWTRTNHRGEPVTLVEGPAVMAGALAALAIGQAFPERIVPSRRAAIPLAIAGTGAAAFGVYDDLTGSGKRRGLRGHLGALAHGEVTTGAVKLLGIGATGLAAAAAQGGGPADVVINAGLIAGGANLLNLFDLRPGRAIKVAAASGALLAATDAGDRKKRATFPGGHSAPWGHPRPPWPQTPPAEKMGMPFRTTIVTAPALGAALALLPEDLGERAMLGDGGANALGAMLGAAAAATLPRPARAGLLAGITALTLASEKVSFTKVIERTPPLHWLDMLGRRPPRPPA